MRALATLRGESHPQSEYAAMASRLEIDILGEPIGKQDQYAAALGGFNIIRFHKDDSVIATPLHISFKKRAILESHCLLFYTGITRSFDHGKAWTPLQPMDLGLPREGQTQGQGPTELIVSGSRCTLFFGTHSRTWGRNWQRSRCSSA